MWTLRPGMWLNERRGYVFTKFTSLFIMLLIFGFITEEDQIKIGLTLGNLFRKKEGESSKTFKKRAADWARSFEFRFESKGNA